MTERVPAKFAFYEMISISNSSVSITDKGTHSVVFSLYNMYL